MLITFAGAERGTYYEIDGEGELAVEQEVREKWVWWWLYWHPHQAERYWEPREKHNPTRSIINVQPLEARMVHGGKLDELKKNMPRF